MREGNNGILRSGYVPRSSWLNINRVSEKRVMRTELHRDQRGVAGWGGDDRWKL